VNDLGHQNATYGDDRESIRQNLPYDEEERPQPNRVEWRLDIVSYRDEGTPPKGRYVLMATIIVLLSVAAAVWVWWRCGGGS